jgi:hypothetical protein
MKKLLLIKLKNGRVITRDISADKNFPIGAPANDERYALICQAISVNGYTDIDLVSETRYVHIAPSQIETVSIEFTNTMKKA